ncbi:hypothetical protein ACVW16_001237 [Bradyrhizobium sp. USDA 4474]
MADAAEESCSGIKPEEATIEVRDDSGPVTRVSIRAN